MLKPGNKVFINTQECEVLSLIDASKMVIINLKTRQPMEVNISDVSLTAPKSNSEAELPNTIELSEIDDESWHKLQKKLEIIKPIIAEPKNRRGKIFSEASKNSDIPKPTLYRWVKEYENSGKSTSLLRTPRSDKNKTRLDTKLENLIDEKINSVYLRSQKPNVTALARDIELACFEQKIKPPHRNTIRNRVKVLTAATSASRRDGKRGKVSHEPTLGSFPNAEYPLDVMQIDHTPLDIILVDEVKHEAIGRPYLTLGIDVCSRMINGFHLSFDHPASYGVGMCCIHAILPKTDWLKKIGVEGNWPIFGKPRTIHVDNAKEFRGNMLQRATDEYGIQLEWRPVARPQYGGTVERFFSTLAKEIHTLPGATFSNVQAKGEYDSAKKASMTLKQLEKWLTEYIVNVYHNRFHESLKMPPIEAYNKALLGDEHTLGIGLPDPIENIEKLRLDFMPYEKRSVQRYGIALFGIHYYADVLNLWIKERDPDNPKQSRQFTVHYDPRDISQIYFFDPVAKRYYPLPYRDTTHPPVSLWEFKEAKRKLEEQGKENIDEVAIFEAYARMKANVETSVKKTQKARRQVERTKINQQTALTQHYSVENTTSSVESETPSEKSRFTVRPFEDVDE